jgi:L-lactate dehydrogenase (cytochrome)
MTLTDSSGRKLSRILNYDDARTRARSVLPRSLFEYVDGGAEGEVTLRRNLAAFEDIALSPRMGQWSPETSLATTVVGREIAIPVLTAPCGGMRVVHPEGDLGVARAAAAAGTVFIGSSASGYTLEEIAQVQGPKWFQLYRMTGRPLMEQLVQRARHAGYEALVITMDTQVPGLREKDTRNKFTLSRRPDLRTALRIAPQVAARPRWTWNFVNSGMPYVLANTANAEADKPALPLTEMARTRLEPNSPTWEDIAWVRQNWPGPILIKGLLTADDARRAADAGAQGVIVSNHGGRQLDCAPATMDVLPAIVAAVGHDLDVLLDSGVRRGSDVVKAVALGAKAVLVGRLAVYGLAVAGGAGVSYMLNLLRTDMLRTMRLMGCADVRELNEGWVIPGPGGPRRAASSAG